MVKEFLKSKPGQGILAVYVAGCLFAWPPLLSWLVAAVLLVFAGLQLRESLRSNREAAAATGKPSKRSDARHNGGLLSPEAPACDVATILTSALAAKPARAKTQP